MITVNEFKKQPNRRVIADDGEGTTIILEDTQHPEERVTFTATKTSPGGNTTTSVTIILLNTEAKAFQYALNVIFPEDEVFSLTDEDIEEIIIPLTKETDNG